MGYNMFGSNTTKLSDFELNFSSSDRLNIVTGYHEAMIQSSQQDLAIMEAMLKVDAIEIQMRSKNHVNESAIVALREGAITKIKTAIYKAWQWLIDKVRQLTDAFSRAIKKVIHNDLKLLEKYEKDLIAHKDDIGDIEVYADLTYWEFNVDGHLDQVYSFDPPKFDQEKILNLAKGSNNDFESLDLDSCIDLFADSVDISMRKLMKIDILGRKFNPTEAKLTGNIEDIIDKLKTFNKWLDVNAKQKAAALKLLNQYSKESKTFLEGEDDKVVYAYNKMIGIYKKEVLSYYKIKDKTYEEILRALRTCLKEGIKRLHELKSAKSESLNMLTDFYFDEFDSILENTYSDNINNNNIVMESIIDDEFDSIGLLI